MVFRLDPSTTVTLQLTAVTPEGPYRLEITDPEKQLVEHYDTAFEALLRHGALEAVLHDQMSPNSTIVARSELIPAGTDR